MEDKKSDVKQKDTKIQEDCIFSEENVNTGRQPEFDYLRTLGVCAIILTHFYLSFSQGIFFELIIYICYILFLT